ncbi:class I SAM-dependent methyltransferase [Stenotrophomonas sp. NPDC087984]
MLGGLSATPKAARVPIPIDPRADWVGALTDAGFDRTAPSVWPAEGLLFYLPGAAERYLIDTVDLLSTGGGALAFEIHATRRSQAAASAA